MSVDRRPTDRVIGALLVIVAVAVASEAWTFVVRFVTDPLGARAIPLFVAALLVVGGVVIATRPAPEPNWPAPRVWRAIAIASVSFLIYAAALDWLGFFVATVIEVYVLARLFGGPPAKSLAGAALFSGALYAVFAYVLGLALPVGSLFRVG